MRTTVLLSEGLAAFRVGVIARVAALGVVVGAATVPRGDVFPNAFVSPLLTTVLAPVVVTDLIGDAFLTTGALGVIVGAATGLRGDIFPDAFVSPLLTTVLAPVDVTDLIGDALLTAGALLPAATAPTVFSTFFTTAAVLARGVAVALAEALAAGVRLALEASTSAPCGLEVLEFSADEGTSVVASSSAVEQGASVVASAELDEGKSVVACVCRIAATTSWILFERLASFKSVSSSASGMITRIAGRAVF
mmetsp:Transcript_8941/g.14495  ORF Transcript_8941/g.14495 Transcript_8941/m.14495 type:complete len:250 (-) Transcript_8941:1383-2132(-)